MSHDVRRGRPTNPSASAIVGPARPRLLGGGRKVNAGSVPGEREPTRRCGWERSAQLTVSTVSSITNDVCRETSSVPLNASFTVCPANEERLNDFCA